MRFKEGKGRDKDGITSITPPQVWVQAQLWVCYQEEPAQAAGKNEEAGGSWAGEEEQSQELDRCLLPPLHILVRCDQVWLALSGRPEEAELAAGDSSTDHLTRHTVSQTGMQWDDKEPDPIITQHPITIK